MAGRNLLAAAASALEELAADVEAAPAGHVPVGAGYVRQLRQLAVHLWEDSIAAASACPYCGAAPDASCLTSDDRPAFKSHKARTGDGPNVNPPAAPGVR